MQSFAKGVNKSSHAGLQQPPGSAVPGEASVLGIPSCDLLLPHVCCHLVLHHNLG